MGALRGQICGSKGCISRHRARSTDELGEMLAHPVSHKTEVPRPRAHGLVVTSCNYLWGAPGLGG